MLREMNVKYDSGATTEELKRQLQQEHHRLWRKSISTRPAAGRQTGRGIIRKRKKEATTGDLASRQTDTDGATNETVAPGSRQAPAQVGNGNREISHHPIQKPKPGKPWKDAADGTEPFNRKKRVFESVLRRCAMRCERCGIQTGQGTESDFNLKPYHIVPLAQGGENSVKNVVALCPTCFNEMGRNPDVKYIKALKRKTRAKLYDTLQVVRKKSRKDRPRLYPPTS